MAHTKQALKRHRQNLKARTRNRAANTGMKSAIKRVVTSTDAKTASEGLARAMKTIDKAAKHGVIHKNTASRYKSRVARAINRLAKTPAK